MEYLPPINHKIIGHRGVAGLAPENTLSGFQLASQLGLNWVEFDTQPCSSGEWVVFHDEINLPYEQLKNLDVGSTFDIVFQNEPIPLLEETLVLLGKLNIHPNIEIKWFPSKRTNKQHALQEFIALLKKVWLKSNSSKFLPLVSSFDWEILILLRKLMPELPLGFIKDDCDPLIFKQLIDNQINTFHCNYQSITKPIIDKANALGIPIMVYTVNSVTDILTLKEMGVSGIFSDLTFLK